MPAKPKTSRQEHLEHLLHLFPELPLEAILKEDLLTEGVSTAAPGVAPVICLEGGALGLRRTVVRADVRRGSPYLLTGEGQAGALVDRASRAPLALVRPFPSHSPYLDKRYPDGSLYSDLLAPNGEAFLQRHCDFVGDVGCLFCSPLWAGGTTPATAEADPARLTQAVKGLFQDSGVAPKEQPNHINIHGGHGAPAGAGEAATYLRYVRAVQEATGNTYPIGLASVPLIQAEERKLWGAGVNVRHSHLEVWDRGLFGLLCPSKERAIGWEEWVRRLLDQVYVFGEGRVQPGLAIGLELVPPHGFASWSEAVESTAQGLDFLMAHGVTPSPIHWVPKARKPRPPVEFFLGLDQRWYELWERHRLPEPVGQLMGPGRSRFPHSAAFDLGRGETLGLQKRREQGALAALP